MPSPFDEIYGAESSTVAPVVPSASPAAPGSYPAFNPAAVMASDLAPVPVPPALQPVTAPAGTEQVPPIPPPTMQTPVASMPAVTEARAGSVEAASQDITRRLNLRTAVSRYTGVGAENRSQEEVDMATLTPTQQDEKYGEAQANLMRRAYHDSLRNYSRLSSGERSPGEIITDSTMDVGNAFVGGLGSLAALAGSGVDAVFGTNLGPWGSRQVESLNRLTRENQSDALQGRQEVTDARAAIAQEVNDQTFQRERETLGSTTAHLRRVGRGFMDGVEGTVSDPVTLTSGVASGVGSLLSAGPVAAGLRRIGVAALSNVTGRAGVTALEMEAAGGSRAARAILSAADEAPPVAGIGLTEAGGAFQQTVSDVQGMSFEDLRTRSPAFVELTKPVSEGGRGLSNEDARNLLANQAGRTAAAIQGPAAAVTGMAAQRIASGVAGRSLPYLETAPFRVGSVGSAAGQAIGEFVEEGIQSGTGAIGQNLGVSGSGADPNRSVTRGVGEQAGQGAILGFGTAGALQAPGAARRGIADALGIAAEGVRAVGGAAAEVISNRADQVRARNEEQSPLSETNIRTESVAATAAVTQAAQQGSETIAQNTNLTPEQRQTGQEFTDRVARSNVVDPTVLADPAIPESVRGATDQVDALFRVAKALHSSKDPAEQAALSRALMHLNARMDDLMDVDPDQVKGILPDNHPALQAMTRFQDLVSRIQESPAITRALQASISAITTSQASVTPTAIDQAVSTVANSNITPQVVQDALTVAQNDPASSNPQAVQRILYHASKGTLNLTPEQEASLKAAQSTVESARRAVQAARDQGHVSNLTEISNRVLVEDKGNRVLERSAARHAKGIVQAVLGGDIEEAKLLLEDLGKFVQHMSNKVDAVNRHFELGSSAPKQQSMSLQPDRSFKLAGAWGVTPTHAKSVEFAQRVSIEASMLADVYNGLVDAFPSLDGERITPAEINESLRGNVNQVAQWFKTGTRTNKTEKTLEQKTDELVAENEVLNEQEAQEAEQQQAAEQESQAAQEDQSNSEVVDKTEDAGPTIVAEAYPELIGMEAGSKVRNVFTTSFLVPKTKKSNLFGSGSPLALVRSLLANNSIFAKTVGDSSPKYRITSDVAEQYKGLLSLVPDILNRMNGNLRVEMAHKIQKTNNVPIPPSEQRTRLERLIAGEPINEFSESRSLNITEINSDGQITYNQELVEGAVLAGIQWLIDNINGHGNYNEEDISKALGLNEDQIDEVMLDHFNSGMPTVEVKRSLAAKIVSFWGLNKNQDSSLENIEGIPEAVASEIVEAMLGMKLLRITELKGVLTDEGPRDYDVYNVNQEAIPPQVMDVPSAIEMVSVIEREPKSYFGEKNFPKTATHGVRNPMVQNTDGQKQMIRSANRIQFFADSGMANFFVQLGEKGVVSLFGFGDLSKVPMNEQDKLSKDGKNKSLISAYRSIMDRMGEMQNIQGEEPWYNLPMHYEHNVTRVGRLMMIGAYNPQADKLAREVFLPTWSNLDLSGSNQDDLGFFRLALAQALDIKIHKQMPDQINKKLDEVLGSLAPTIDRLKGLDGMGDLGDLDADFIQDVKSDFEKAGIPLTPLALHALMEQARLEETPQGDRAHFTTSIYLEADGVTNGVMNAMAMFSSGNFTTDFVKNMARGGMLFGQDKISTLNEQYQRDKKDVYEVAADITKETMNDLIRGLPANLRSHGLNLALLTSLLMPGMSVGKNQDTGLTEITVGRQILKNPMTITLYGSGPRGIAGKLSTLLTKEIYAIQSKLAQAQKNGLDPSTVFLDRVGGDPAAARRAHDFFVQAIDELTEFKAVTNKLGKHFLIQEKGLPPLSRNHEKFFFNSTRADALTQNMLFYLVKPMLQGINQTIGSSVLKNTNLLRMATQAQSIVYQHKFNAAVAAQIEKNKKDPDWVGRAFTPSPNQMKEIAVSLEKYAPLIETGDQNFLITRPENVNSTVLDGRGVIFGQGLSGGLSTPGLIQGFKDAGVSGIPLLNIGMGDGMGIQNTVNNPRAPKSALYVYDGIHYSVSSIANGSVAANEGAWGAWQNNPMEAVHKGFSSFVGNLKPEDITPMMMAQMSRALGIDLNDPAEQVLDQMKRISQALEGRARSVSERQAVLRQVKQNIDQMAGAARPFTTSGKIELVGTPEEVAHELELIRGAKRITPAKSPEPRNWSNNLGRIDRKTGVQIIGVSNLPKIVKGLTPMLSSGQQQVLDEIRKSMSAKGYKIIVGTPEQISQWQENTGREKVSMNSSPETGEIHGATTYGDKTIYLVSASTTGETVIHELIHASTFEKVQAYYENKPTDEITEAAILNLENLMGEFLSLDPDQISKLSFNEQQSYQNAKVAIEGYKSTSQASALNEFMAWTLANKSLGDLTSGTKVGVISRLVQAAMNALKKLVFGRRHLPLPSDDMFSNVLFNSSIIMRAQPTIASMAASTVNYMSVPYGTSDRLTQLQAAFDQLITQYVDTDRGAMVKAQRENIRDNARIVGEQAANTMIAVAFPNMTMQEKSLFTSIMAAISTDMLHNQSSVAEMEKLYRHTINHLKSEDVFMKDPVANDPNDRAQANMKLRALRGEFTTGFDGRKRSYLLPVFFALSATNDEFRAAMAKVPAPTVSKVPGKTLDEQISNTAMSVMGHLSNYISGANPKAKNISDAMDHLMHTIQTQIQQKQGFIEQFSSPLGSGIDRTNDYVVTSIDRLAKSVEQKLGNLKTRVSNKHAKVLLTLGQMAIKIATEDGAKNVSEGVSQMLNSMNGWQTFRETMGNFIGRTDSNAGVYDRIKIVRTDAQQDRQTYREQVPLHIASKFSRALSDTEWGSLYKGLGKTDAAALIDSLGHDGVLDLFTHQGKINGKIMALENSIQSMDPLHFSLVQAKAQQLANFMNTGTPGKNLLRNALAVSKLLNEKKDKKRQEPSSQYIEQVDQLISLYALDGLSQTDKQILRALVRTEPKGLDFALHYMEGQRAEELHKATNLAVLNSYKGFMPTENQVGVSLLIAEDREFSKLSEKSYIRVGDYRGSSSEIGASSKGYYFAPVNGRAAFNQGIFQTVRQTSGGVDINTGMTHDGLTGGSIQDPREVNSILRNRHRETGTKENLLPIFDNNGQVIAFERSIDPFMVTKLNQDTHFARMIGVWRGRQVEEAKAQVLNEVLIDKLGEMYNRDRTDRPLSVKNEYVNIFDLPPKDRVLFDAVKLINSHTLAYAEGVFGRGNFMVRKDMLNDSFGYRNASVGDVWTGNSRWSPQTQKVVKDLAVSVFGNKGYQYLTMTESAIQSVVKEAKTIIVIKSVIVPYANFMSNIFHLIGRGVPIRHIITGLQKKLVETDFYAKSHIEEVRIEAEMRAAIDDPFATKKLETQLQSIKDSQKRLSIWPLIERGEFSSISDAGLTQDDLILTGRNVTGYMETLTNKLPAPVRNAGRQALITKDTALFQGLQKAVAYGDFLAKAVFWDDLTKRQNKSVEKANAIITEEFVNYEVLPGRTRSYLESMGLLWFWNFKIRYAKIALSIMRNNPVHAFMATLIPLPQFMSSGVDMPTEGSMFSKLSNGTLSNSIGWSQGLHAPMLHPTMNLIH